LPIIFLNKILRVSLLFNIDVNFSAIHLNISCTNFVFSENEVCL